MTHFGPIVTLLLALAAQPVLAQDAPGSRPKPRPERSETVAAAPQPAPDPASPAASREIAVPEGPERGPETNLPLPRFVSLSTDRGNVRRGPSLSHRIDWVFLRRDMPLQVTAEYGHWRRVTDREGVGGWMHYAMLSGVRTVIVDAELLPLRSRPQENATVVAQLEAGVVARLGECEPDWCRLTAGGYKGWAPKTLIWGVAPDEIRD
ncbi:SH3-like domain-containing protein [Limimaricola soesokkakensis]|uniref:Bacterial SH3 domain protein n=1 Tax=Limimaricola soesokkakensis TaxID=1343159 RepID=A0A1X6ZKX8_9RHOB|nr:SH3 domain-containing protein [Limimaricola soesokkakensis]PSK84977.1 SH3-like domain-containing protein [Limimaricola soesokkakensis]SLN53994.1 Bacterial SH3 domain protein [Limimaricola soesokkakensis]